MNVIQGVKNQMVMKSSDELRTYVNSSRQYTSQEIWAAVYELERRGMPISENELAYVKREVHLQAKEKQKVLEARYDWKRNVVDDPDALRYFSPLAIMMFSLLFTTIVGSILLAMNVVNRKQRILIFIFGIAFTGVLGSILYLLLGNAGPIFVINGAGGKLMIDLFWNKYIGRETKFRIRPIWGALAITLLVSIPCVYLIIMYRSAL